MFFAYAVQQIIAKLVIVVKQSSGGYLVYLTMYCSIQSSLHI